MDDVGVVYHAVADGVGDGGVAQGGVPVGGRELARDDRGRVIVSVFQNLQEVPSFGVLQRRDQKIVEHQNVELGETGEHAGIGSVGSSDREFLQQSRDPGVQGPVSMAARRLGESRRQVALATSGFPDADHVVTVVDPAACGQVADGGLGDASSRGCPHIFHRGINGELRLSQQSRQPAVLPGRPLPVDHLADLLAEAHLIARCIRVQFQEGFRQSCQLHLA